MRNNSRVLVLLAKNRNLKQLWAQDYQARIGSVILTYVCIPVPSQHGEVDCWPMPCAPLTDCEFVAVPEGECCPHCISDPCQEDTLYNDITKTCVDEYGVTRLSGSTWNKHGTECSICQCKVKGIQLYTTLYTRLITTTVF